MANSIRFFFGWKFIRDENYLDRPTICLLLNLFLSLKENITQFHEY